MGEALSQLLRAVRLERDAFVWMDFNDRATGDALIFVAVTRLLIMLGLGGSLFGLTTSLSGFEVLIASILNALVFWLAYSGISYAITKFLSLRQLGIDGEDMRIVVLRDEAIGIPHAVLVVFVDGEAWLLDNRLRDVVRADRMNSYRPIYSIDGEHWILYKDRS